VFLVALLIVAILSGATASIVGFGIGSLLTPLVAMQTGMSLAVSLVTVPHAVATTIRAWRLRRHVDTGVLKRFGILSAAGALAGAVFYTRLGPSALTRILGGLLILTAMAQLTGWSSRWRPRGLLVGVFGVLSGFFGGIAGNQGGLRSAALTAFGLAPKTFVATATATGLLVDAARTPVYLWFAGPELSKFWLPIGVATVGVTLGTVAGERLLLGLSPKTFGRLLGIAVGALGIWLLF
jgi:uncharacterized membrane protein YfcA